MKKFAPIAMLLLLAATQFGVAQQSKGKNHGMEFPNPSPVQPTEDHKAPSPSVPNARDPHNPESDLVANDTVSGEGKPFLGKYPPRESVFTLPLSTNYNTPVSIQRILMEMMMCYPKEALTWRDEYKVIHENKTAVRSWLIQKMKEKQLFHQDNLNQQMVAELKYLEAAKQHGEEATNFARRIVQQWTQTYESSQASFHIQQRDSMRQKANDLHSSQEAQRRAVEALAEWIEYSNTGW